MLDRVNRNKVAKLADKKKQGPIGMTCVKWHMRDGKPWRCARFRPPDKPTLGVTKPKRKRKAKLKVTTQKKRVVATRKKPVVKRKPVAKRKPKAKAK